MSLHVSWEKCKSCNKLFQLFHEGTSVSTTDVCPKCDLNSKSLEEQVARLRQRVRLLEKHVAEIKKKQDEELT